MKTQTLKPYPAYRDSGLQWLTEMPKHWATERAKWLFQRIDRPVRPGDDVVTCFRDGIVTLRKKRRVRGFTESLKEIGYQGVREGDLVIHAMDAFAGAAGVSDSDGKCTPVYAVCQPKQDVDSRYYAHIVREMARTQWIAALAKGIRERSTDFRFDDFAGQVVPVPSKEEQDAIVAFLAHADRRINRLIRAKRRLIELLNEQKQAIIHRAVTLGLDPGVRLKPSGVDSLGDVPKHWELSRVKREFKCLNHRRIPLSAVERGTMTSRQYNYYGASGVIDKVDDYLFDDELLLIAEDGANLVLRNLPLAIVARGKFWVNNNAHILKPKRGNLEYLANLMEVVDYRRWISGAAQPKLTQDRIMAIRIPVPPPDEQDRIQAHLDAVIAPFRSATDRAQREIGLVREYRTRLVADVVTGKLDVRDVELPALDKDEVLEDWDEDTEEEAEEIAETEEIALADV